MDDATQRLLRIEDKLDKVSDAIVSLARMEERMITLFKRMDNYDSAQNDITKRVGFIERKIASSEWIERLVWALIGICGAAFVAFFK